MSFIIRGPKYCEHFNTTTDNHNCSQYRVLMILEMLIFFRSFNPVDCYPLDDTNWSLCQLNQSDALNSPSENGGLSILKISYFNELILQGAYNTSRFFNI